jgi:excisionase family DNA binding protein
VLKGLVTNNGVGSKQRALAVTKDTTMAPGSHRATTSAASQISSIPDVSIADRIVKIGHALTVSELAEILNVSRAFLYRLAASGRVPCLRLGAAVRFDPTSVAAWLRKDMRDQYR